MLGHPDESSQPIANGDTDPNDSDNDASSSSSSASSQSQHAHESSSRDDPQLQPEPSNMIEDLTQEETEKLLQLQDITGIEDMGICRALLESKNWDLDATAREQLDIPGPANNEQPPAPPPPPTPPRMRPIHAHHNAPNIRVFRGNRVGQQEGGRGFLWTILDWSFFIFTLPLTFPFKIMNGVFRIVSSVVGMHQAAIGGPSNPVGDVRQFCEDFDKKYGNRHPPFHRGTYSQALEDAKKDLKFLVVYLHSPEHQDTEAFCRDSVCSQQLCDYMQTHNILFWGCSVESSEGYRVSLAVRESSYPFLAVIVLRQNKMMIVGRVEGYTDPDSLVQRLEVIIRDNEAFIVATRMEREERNLNQIIREEQDAAFQETLRQDQEKERKKREEEERKRLEEEEERKQIQEEQDRKERIKKMKIDLVTEIPEEPPADQDDVVKILIKLPGGQRLERRFCKSHTLRDLYLFVFCHPESPDEFEIATNFPKRVLACHWQDDGKKSPSFEESGLGQSTMLFVHDLEA